ncbi:interferon-inducible GTPase 1-like [Mercenaria mercenaria]|uniref:interferon-inducible GTPase 1-like n=1 Tax=Mercenaria mercenaria TaxID=6596 RepID=UPI00234E59B3|nr:interferon-inducible GTPase 1-like [Mercenaria mercenaria]
MTEDEKKKIILQWREKDLQKCLYEKDFMSLAKSKIESWKNELVNVAVLGRTGVGKSRFINAIRDCQSEKESDYAPTGSTETTSTPKAYPHPRNKLLQLWDLPGIGTKNFPRKDYIRHEKIRFYSYDIYIIMASDRFTEDEVFFAEKLDESGKVFIFVRSRVDINLDGVDDMEAEVNKIRKDCEEIVKTSTVKSKDVYLISSKLVDHRYLDFPKLIERLVEKSSGLKKEAVMYSLQYNTKKMINGKAGALESRLVWTGLKAAFGAAILVPDLSLTVDYRSISSEMEFYRKTLGITDSDLQDLAKITGKTVDVLKHEYKLQTFDIFKITTKDVTELGMQFAPYLKHISMSEALESTVKSLPVISSALGFGISFATAYCFLRSNLHLMLEDARTMFDILLKETGSEILYIN